MHILGDHTDMKRKTGKFIEPTEFIFVTQLFGAATSEPNQEKREQLNNYMKMLAMKYEVKFDGMEIEPPKGEIIEQCDDCDSEIPAGDVEIEE